MKVLDLFSGIGGFSLGLERAGFETVAFCEIEEFPRKVLRKHWPDVPIYEDVRELTYERLQADGIDGIDVITGGFPCQDISVAGKQKGIKAERSGLWSELCRIIGDIRPRYTIVENVTALLSGDNGRWFQRVLGDLAEIGYDAEWHCISASELGANHHRDRVWIIAYPMQVRGKRLRDKLAELIQRGSGGACYEENSDHDAADPLCQRQQGQGWPNESSDTKKNDNREVDRAFHAFRWPSKSPVRGRNDGIPRGLDKDRLTGIGNAVVPQIPELIGRAIMAVENDHH